MSKLTDTKILNLLERLSVVAPERWQLNCASIGMNGKRTLHLRMSGSYKAMSLVIQEGQPLHPRDVAHILYAVLEEAHVQGWEWSLAWGFSMGPNTPYCRTYRLYPRDYDYFTPDRPIAEITEPKEGDVLEREVLPRFECLVVALETKGRAM